MMSLLIRLIKTHLSDLDEEDQLILNLQNRQIVQPHPMGGIQIIPETNQVISPRYGTLNNMIAIGQVTNGVNKLRNGVKMIVDQAVNLQIIYMKTKVNLTILIHNVDIYT